MIYYQKSVIFNAYCPDMEQYLDIVASAAVEYNRFEREKGEMVIKLFKTFPY